MSKSTQPQIPDESTETDDTTAGLIPTVGISKKQTFVVVGVVVVAALIIWRLRNSDGGSTAAAEIDKAKNDELTTEVEFDDEEDDDEEIRVPTDPADELEKDAAVIEALQQSGKLGAS